MLTLYNFDNWQNFREFHESCLNEMAEKLKAERSKKAPVKLSQREGEHRAVYDHIGGPGVMANCKEELLIGLQKLN